MKNLLLSTTYRTTQTWIFRVCCLFVLFTNAGFLQAQVATIQTDKPDYMPGETVIITGTGWLPGETVNMVLEHTIFVHPDEYLTAVANGQGNIYNATYIIDPADLGESFLLTATGASSGLVATTTFTDGGGDYSIDFSAYDPELYLRAFPGSVTIPTARGSSPLNPTNYNQTVESLSPENLGLGQIVAFEFYVTVGSSGSCFNDEIQFTGRFSTETTSGRPFGFNSSYNIYAAFVDVSSGGGLIDPGNNASVTGVTSTPGSGYFDGTIRLGGLDPGDVIPVEVWVVLQGSIPAGTTGNVQSSLQSARTLGTCAPNQTISTGSQTVPLLRVGEFFSSDVDVQIIKTDSPDPVTMCNNLVYTILVTNTGPSVANLIVITDILDINTSYISHSVTDNTGAAWTFLQSGQTLTFSSNFLNKNESATITVTVAVNGTAPYTGTGGPGSPGNSCTGDIKNLVSVTTISEDTNTANNSYCQPTDVICETIPPVFTFCPQNINLGCNPTLWPAGTPTATDCSTVTFTSVLGPEVNVSGCTYSKTRTYTATDRCGNTSTCAQTYTYTKDNTGPLFSACPTSPIDLGCNPPVITGAQAIASAGAVLDGCGGTVTKTATGGAITNTNCVYSQTWTVTATDMCNNSTQCNVTYTWIADLVDPVFASCPTGSINLGNNPAPITEAQAITSAGSVSDACGGTVTKTASGGTITNPSGCNYSQVWTVTAIDGCGNDATCQVTYTWTTDVSMPYFVNCPDVPYDLGCNPVSLPDAAMAIFDVGSALPGCDENCQTLTVTASGGTISGECLKTQAWTVTASDNCGHFSTCTVAYIWTEDLTAPVIATAAVSGDKGCNPTIEAPVFTLTEACSPGDIVATTAGVTGEGCAKSQTWTANFTDACLNAAVPVSITYTWTEDAEAPLLSNTPSSNIVADCGTLFGSLPWQLPQWFDNCGMVIPVSDVIDPPTQTTFPATYTRTWIVEDGCGNENSFSQTILVPDCEQEYCTVTQFTLGSSIGSFCDGTSSYNLMNDLLIEHGPIVVGIPANNRTFTVPVDGGAECIIDRFPSYNNAFYLTGNWGCGNFGNLLQPDGRFNNTLLVEAITMQFNLWMTPALGDLLLENSAFYIRSASGCGGEDDYPLDDQAYYEIHSSVYNYLGPDPTVQDLFDLANLALGSTSLPGPNAPTLSNIKYALKWINEGFENCGFIYFVPPLTNNIELSKTGTYIDNEPMGVQNAGDQIAYSFSVSNVGNLTLSNVIINDPLVSVTGGPIASLAPGTVDNSTFSAVYTLTDEDLNAGSLTNVATVIGFVGSNAYYDTDDDVQVFEPNSRILDVSLLLEGLYNGPGIMRQAYDENGPHFEPGVADMITVELHSTADYSSILYSNNQVKLSTSGHASLSIPNALTGSYYITIRHRNSVATTTSVPVSMSGNSVSYTFDSPSKAYGNNLLLMITGEYVIFGGDVNQDGVVDTADMTPEDNDAANFVSGYIATDVNGDGIIDTADMTIVDNNAAGFVGSVHP